MNPIALARFAIRASAPAIESTICPTLAFEHAGQQYTLNKHPSIQTKLRASQMTIAEALLKPWYLRKEIDGKARLFSLAVKDKDAIRAAKDILNGRIEQPGAFSEFLAQRDAKRGLTIGALAEQWITAGLPFSKTKSRDPAAVVPLQGHLERGLPFWKTRAAGNVTRAVIEDFVVWRRANIRPGKRITGSRSADLQLAALSCLFQWAVNAGLVEENPFGEREKYADNVKHCHQNMPAGDDQLHQVLQWHFSLSALGADPDRELERITCGAWLAFTALTGLRPGEPAKLTRQRPSKHFPANLDQAPYGLIYRMPDQTWRMKVYRLKHGQNPAILIHPALRSFLRCWLPYRDRHFPGRVELFPDVIEERVRDYLDRACREMKLPALKPHGTGRAYYVRVRRSQGTDDVAISVELGQTSSGKLIRSIYGNPVDPVGGCLHDWLPAHKHPAWHLLCDTTVIRRDTAKLR